MEISPVQEFRALREGTARCACSIGVMILSTARLAVCVVQMICTVYIVTFTTARNVAERATVRSSRGMELDLLRKRNPLPVGNGE